MFSLDNKECLLRSVNPRAEIHGEDRVPAVDIGFSFDTSNEILSEFHSSLRSALYSKGSPKQSDLLPETQSNMPSLKFAEMAPIKWKKEFAGHTLVVHQGISGASDVKLIDCEVKDFVFDCRDGGTVGVSFKVIAHPEAAESGQLNMLVQQKVNVSLLPPAHGQTEFENTGSEGVPA